MRKLLAALALVAVLAPIPGSSGALAGEGEEVVLSFAEGDIPLESVLEAFRDTAGLPLFWSRQARTIVGAQIAGPLEIRAPREEVLDHLRALLVPYELVVIPLGPGPAPRLFVADARAGTAILKLKAEPVVVTARNVEALAAQDGRFVTTALRAEHLASLRDARNAMQRLVTGQNIGSVTEVPEARSLIVTDFAPNVAAIYRLLRAMDVPPESAPVAWVQVIELEHAEADVVADALVAIFQANAPAPWKRAAPGPAWPEGADTGLRIFADPRLNQLLVRGTPAQLEAVQGVLERMDRPLPEED
jgi:type II secretory pathway component GspD/PulD (secretin)